MNECLLDNHNNNKLVLLVKIFSLNPGCLQNHYITRDAKLSKFSGSLNFLCNEAVQDNEWIKIKRCTDGFGFWVGLFWNIEDLNCSFLGYP